MSNTPEDFLSDGAETYSEKNDDYGDSWRQVGQILWLLAGQETITLESVEDVISFGLYTRRLDKLARSFNGEFVADELEFESVLDSHVDEMVYASMAASNQTDREQHPWEPSGAETLEIKSVDMSIQDHDFSGEARVGIDHTTVKPGDSDESG